MVRALNALNGIVHRVIRVSIVDQAPPVSRACNYVTTNSWTQFVSALRLSSRDPSMTFSYRVVINNAFGLTLNASGKSLHFTLIGHWYLASTSPLEHTRTDRHTRLEWSTPDLNFVFRTLPLPRLSHIPNLQLFPEHEMRYFKRTWTQWVQIN